MSRVPRATDLHLPSLSIRNFRGIADLSIPRLGRVTLIAGKNGAGKTTLLEAVRVYAERGSVAVLSSILQSREEMIRSVDEDGDVMSVPDFRTLAYGRRPSEDTCISIGPVDGRKRLNIRFGPAMLRRGNSQIKDFMDADQPWLTVEFEGVKENISAGQATRLSFARWAGIFDGLKHTEFIRCESSGPSSMDNETMSRLWDNVALTDYETEAVQALRLIYGDDVDRVAMIGETGARIQEYPRRAIVKMKGQKMPVPLRSLGDGAVRMFGTGLCLANSRDGFLVVDEVENGLHYLMQADFWRMVLQAAHDNQVQVLATTHSWDCVVGFARAIETMQDVDGLLLRVDQLENRMRVVEYAEEDLQVIARQGIEVR